MKVIDLKAFPLPPAKPNSVSSSHFDFILLYLGYWALGIIRGGHHHVQNK
jgi:hypothetical protein